MTSDQGIDQRVSDLFSAITSEDTPRKIPTGFNALDLVLAGGLAPSTVTVLFGHPGVGVSTLALNIATTAAACAIPTLYLSWETAPGETTQRVLSARARVPLQSLRERTLDEDGWQKVAAQSRELADVPLDIAAPAGTHAELAAQVSVWRDAHEGPALVVLDGPGILARRNARTEGAWEEHSRLSAMLKGLAMDLEIAVVVTSPVIREALRVPKVPQCADVAYSPAYAADADLVIALFREDLFDLASPRVGEADVIVRKSRYTPTSGVTLAFQGHYGRFVSMV